LGGQPAFAEPLHVGRPNVGDRARLFARLNDLFDRRWLTNNGPYVQEFERRITELTGAAHCIAVCNATVGLEIAIRAAGLTGEVIVPSFTFIATAHALQWQEITPVFADVDPETHCLDPDAVEQMITPRTTGIIGVHVWGRACDVDGLTAVARRHNLKLLFDAAHAFGCSHRGRPIGNFGLAEVFSFHATKFLNTGEGGAIVTNDDDVAAKVRLMTNFGFAGYDNVIYTGTNGKLSETAAAMGVTNLESLDEFIATNRRNYQEYGKELEGIPGVHVLPYDEDEKNNYQYVVLEIDENEAGLSRDELLAVLKAENVLARRYFFPGCHRMEPYGSFFPHSHFLLPVTKKLVLSVLQLPTGTAVGSSAIRTIGAIIRTAVDRGGAIRERLSAKP
jgi:dTDP-4-amino-4,6-dideoxygalactose transaminase